jgi:hypothetical protein
LTQAVLALALGRVPSWADPISFTSRTHFNAMAGPLVFEEFEEGKADPGNASSCWQPLDATSNNSCFNAGGLVASVQFTTLAHDCFLSPRS